MSSKKHIVGHMIQDNLENIIHTIKYMNGINNALISSSFKIFVSTS